MSEQEENLARQLEQMRQRMDLLERDNQRLREKMDPMLGPDNPWFNPKRFIRSLSRILLLMFVPLFLMPLVLPLAMIQPFRSVLVGWKIGPIPICDIAGIGTWHPGVGFGIIGYGGVGFGVIAFGGMSVGLIAIGGGAIGIFAIGGGSVGLIAIGGGAVGYVAIGGGACGHYAMGQRAAGKYVLALNRQDDKAIEFFTHYFPSLRASVTTPMPVIPLDKTKNTSAG